jgi:hypothetical protein
MFKSDDDESDVVKTGAGAGEGKPPMLVISKKPTVDIVLKP